MKLCFRVNRIHKTYIWSDGPQTEFEVKGLQNSHIYQFRVYAQNEAGRGEALLNKNVVRIKAATKKPPSPTKPSAGIQDDESVLLQWNIPPGFSDVNYIVERYESKSDLWMQCNHEVVMIKSYLVTGLTAGKEYKFRITSENAHGVSAPSDESDLVILKDHEGEPPTVLVPVTDCLVKVDESASFSCQYSGTQPILVNWSKDGIRVREGFGACVTTETSKSTLTLEDVESDDDECSVQCDLRNAEGKATSRAKIQILAPPKINCSSSYKEGLTFDKGDNLRLKVNFTGKPTPKVKWFFNGLEHGMDGRAEVSLLPEFIEVRISDLKHTDAGRYEFVAENDMGRDSSVVEVTVTGPPSPPAGFPSLEIVSEEEILLKWNIPVQDGGSSVFSYVVEILQPENHEWERFAAVHDTFLQISDMTILEKSFFRIRAVNIYGASEPSKECQYNAVSEGFESACDSKLLANVSTEKNIDKIEILPMEDQSANVSPLLLDGNVRTHDFILDLEATEDNMMKENRLFDINSDRCVDKSTAVKTEDNEPSKISGVQDLDTVKETEDDKTKDQLLDINSKSYTDETPVVETEGIQKSESFGVHGNTNTENKINEIINQPGLDIDICSEVNENINRAISIAELHEYRLVAPLKVMYVGTQTLMPILNYACSDVHDFDDIIHFAAGVLPVEEYLVQSIDHILCYTICCFSTTLETSLVFSPAETSHVFSPTLHFHDCSLQNFLPVCYDCKVEEYRLKIFNDKAYYIENYTNEIEVSEEVYIDTLFSKLGVEHTNSSIQCNYKEAVCVWFHPWIFDCFLPFISDTISKHNLAVTVELYNCIAVSETFVLSSPITFQIRGEMKRAISVTHIPEEFQTLAGLKCVPMTSYKPALSVLPMSRTTAETIMERRNKNVEEFEAISDGDKLFPSSFNRRTYDLTGKVKGIFDDECVKCDSVPCLCSLLGSSDRGIYSVDNEFMNNNIKFYEQNELEDGLEWQTATSSHNISVNDKIPEWLRYVSPFYMPAIRECTDEGAAVDFKSDKLLSKEFSAENESSKIFLKDNSVQELLHLAEEVEKSFTQKTKHIESLENVLLGELSSLEKDLEVVHKIHDTLWNESQVPWIGSSSCVTHDSKSFYEYKTIEKDLIDFKKDIPSMQSLEARAEEEYAPVVLTHLQNRFVQCGCRTRLYCSISGKPDPQIAWMKNGKILPQSNRYVCSNLVEFGLYIDIFNAKSSDSGEYTCTATNCHGSAQTTAYLRVAGHREDSPEEPKFLTSPNDITVTEGESVKLEWQISGTPVPHVMWFKNAERIQTSLRIDAFSNHRGCCRLVLHNLRADDGAIYTCYLENEAGSSVSTVLVSVVTDGQHEHCEEPLDVADLTLSNLLSSNEDTNIPSMQYLEKLLNKKKNPSLVGTSGKCRAHKGTKRVPGSPFAPRILNSGKTFVILAWTAPINRIAIESGLIYLLEKRLLECNRWKEVGRTANTLYTVSGLTPGHSYVFRISAGNSDGWGPPVMLTEPVHCGKGVRPMISYNDQIY